MVRQLVIAIDNLSLSPCLQTTNLNPLLADLVSLVHLNCQNQSLPSNHWMEQYQHFCLHCHLDQFYQEDSIPNLLINWEYQCQRVMDLVHPHLVSFVLSILLPWNRRLLACNLSFHCLRQPIMSVAYQLHLPGFRLHRQHRMRTNRPPISFLQVEISCWTCHQMDLPKHSV